MVLQRQVDDLARFEAEIAIKRLREATKIANKYKRLLPTIRKLGGKATKRAAADVLVQRDVSRWVRAADDDDYNTKAADMYEYSNQEYDVKYNSSVLTTKLTPAYMVAAKVRRLVDPYIKKFGDPALQGDNADNSNNNEEEAATNSAKDASQSVKIESQTQPPAVVEEIEDEADGDLEDDYATNLTGDELENDWGLQ
jgi:hypothetical protein